MVVTSAVLQTGVVIVNLFLIISALEVSGPKTDSKRARNPYSWLEEKRGGFRSEVPNKFDLTAPALPEEYDTLLENTFEIPKRARNPYSWMNDLEKRSRNPYSWMNFGSKRAPMNPYSWQYA
uniref:Cardio acceleratory peptide 2b n=1 Tax=Syphacia muris TaxID=451379 RepID=A0A0N5ABY6_9BILA